jgi:hypothetical protein
MKEVSRIQETVNELNLLEEQSKTVDSTIPGSIEMESLRLIEKVQESQEERKSLTKDDQKEALQIECDQLKEDIRETLSNVSFISPI